MDVSDLPMDFSSKKTAFDKPPPKKRKGSSPASASQMGNYPILKSALAAPISSYDDEDDDNTMDIALEVVNGSQENVPLTLNAAAAAAAAEETRKVVNGNILKEKPVRPKNFTARPKPDLKRVSPVKLVRSPTPIKILRSPTPVNQDTSDSDSSPIFRRRPVSKGTLNQVLDKISARNTKKDQETQCEGKRYFEADLRPGFVSSQQPVVGMPRDTSTPDRCIREASPALVDHNPKADGIGLFLGKYFSTVCYLIVALLHQPTIPCNRNPHNILPLINGNR